MAALRSNWQFSISISEKNVEIAPPSVIASLSAKVQPERIGSLTSPAKALLKIAPPSVGDVLPVKLQTCDGWAAVAKDSDCTTSPKTLRHCVVIERATVNR